MGDSREQPTAHLFDGPGQIRALCRAVDWARTPLGPVERWPAALRAAARLCIDSRTPMALWAGGDLTLIYNEGYVAILGERHQWAMGRPAREVWSELYADFGPELEQVRQSGTGTRHGETRYRLERHGRVEDGWFVYTFNPVRGEDGAVVAVLNVVEEVTETVRARREREAFLLQLSDALRPLDEPLAIKEAATAVLQRTLRVSRAQYIEFSDDANLSTVRAGAAAPGVRPLRGDFATGPFGQWLREARQQGLTVASADIEADPAIAPETRGVYAGFDVRAFVSVPLHKGGQLRAALTVHQTTPRSWTPEEIAAVEETAERTWAAVERARAERAVRASEEKYRALFSSIDEGIEIAEVRFDAEGRPAGYRILESNPSRARMAAQLDDGTGQVEAARAAIEPGWTERLAQVARSGEPVRFEHHDAPADRWLSVQVSRIGGEGSPLVALLFDDITERKRREAHLAALDQISTVTSALEGAGEIIAAVGACLGARMALDACHLVDIDDIEGHASVIEAWPRRGESPAAALELRLSRFVSEETRRALRAGRPLVVTDVRTDPRVQPGSFAGLPSVAFLSVPFHRGGEWRYQLSVISHRPRCWRDDEVELLQEVAARVFPRLERARVEAELRESRRWLEQDQARLRDAQRRLEETDRRKNEFLAVLSHELRNPLTPIVNSLHVLERAEAGGPQARRARAVIERQIDLLSHLVDDLLDVTRITRGKIQLQRRRVELGDLARRTLDDHRGLLGKAGLEVVTVMAPAPLHVDADPHRVAQVLANLLQNAAKFTPRGGRVTLSLDEDRAAGQAVLRVSDDGAGMAPEVLARLFEPFMQADETLDRSKGGLGLGLALVKRLVELHGGSVEAKSDGLDRGASFTVRLPLAAATAAATAAAGSTEAPGARRVLIIEDNLDAAESLREVLELDEHEVEVAHDGAAGVAAARRFQPDVVLCDIGLPGMDGFAVAAALRAEETLRGVRLVALSGYARPEDRQRAAEAGFNDHLAKPPGLDKLARLLAALPKRQSVPR